MFAQSGISRATEDTRTQGGGFLRGTVLDEFVICNILPDGVDVSGIRTIHSKLVRMVFVCGFYHN